MQGSSLLLQKLLFFSLLILNILTSSSAAFASERRLVPVSVWAANCWLQLAKGFWCKSLKKELLLFAKYSSDCKTPDLLLQHIPLLAKLFSAKEKTAGRMRTNTLTHTSHAASISLSLSLCLCIHHHASFSGCSWTIETAWVTTAASGEPVWMFHDVKLPTLCLWLIYGILNNITHTCARIQPFYLSSSLLISLKFKWADFGSSVCRYISPKMQHCVTTLKD